MKSMFASAHRNISNWIFRVSTLLFFISLLSINSFAQEKEKAVEVNNLIDKAIVLDKSREVVQADTTLLVQAINLSQKHQLIPEFILAHRRMGDYSLTISQYAKALRHFQIALKEAQKTESSVRDIYLLEVGIARSYMRLNRIDDAQKIFLNHLSQINAQLKETGADSTNILFDKSKTLVNIGVNYSYQGKFEQAIQNMEEAYILTKRSQYPSDSIYQYNKKSMSFQLGSVYLFKGDGKSAKPYILEHLAYIKQQSQQSLDLAKAFGNLAYCEYLLHNFKSAYKYYFKSLDISEKNNYPNASLVTYKDLSDTYLANGKHKESNRFLNKYYLLKDSLQGMEVQQNIDKLRVSFESEQKEQEIVKLNQQNQIAKQQKWLLIAALILAILIGLFAVWYLRHLNKSRKKEEELQQLKMSNLNQELKYKKQDVTRLALEISNKQELAEQLSNQLKQFESHVHPTSKSEWRKLDIFIRNHLHSTDEQKVLHENIEAINHAFFDKLSNKFPNLNRSDRELCSFIRLRLSNKEIAALRNVSPEAIRSGRFRLRKKLRLESKEEVEKFLLQF